MLLFFVFFLSSFSLDAKINQLPEALKQEFLKESCKPKVAHVHLPDSLNIQKTYFTLLEIIKQDDIHGVILSIDHKGGDVAQLSTLCDLIGHMNGIKPVVSLVSGYAGSMGYLLTCSSGYIISHSGSNIGGIGVYKVIEKHQNKKICNNVIESGVTIELFSEGKFKTHLHPDAPRLSDEEREYEAQSLKAIYKYFVRRVSENRGLDIEQHSQWAEGRSFIASDALEVGLIDQIGTILDAEKKIKELISKKNPDKMFEDDVEYCFYNNS